MPAPSIGTTTSATTAGDIILSIRSQIPDPVADPQDDGGAFSYDTLRRWINDAMRVIASTAPVLIDWYAIQSTEGMDIYELPNTTLSVEQLWYDLQVCGRAPEWSTIGETKITGPSYSFSPHSLHAQPRLQVWPCPDRTGLSTTLNGGITATATSLVLTSTTSMMDYGFLMVEDELILYRTVSSTTVSNLLRGQGGTKASAHSTGVTVTERNIMMKMSRLPTPISIHTDPVEIPLGLTPLIELYVMAKVREAEQESVLALQMRREFDAAMEKMANKAQFRGIRQGIQVSDAGAGPWLYHGRVIVP